MNPKVIDNDRDEIAVKHGSHQVRSWHYANEAERRAKILAAREFVEGFFYGVEFEQEREPEPLTYDEALGRKCDAEERLRRELIDAGRGHLVR